MRAVWVVVAMIVGLAAVAAAEPKVAVSGDKDAGVTAAVKKALDKHVALVDAGSADATVVVEVSPGKGKKTWRATVTATAGGELLASYEVTAKKRRLARAAAKPAWKKLGKALRSVEQAPEPAPVAVAEEKVAPPAKVTKEKKAVAAEEPSSGGADAIVSAYAEPEAKRRGAPWLEIAVDGRPFLRTLRYRDDVLQTLRTYDLAAPAAGLTAAWRPMRDGAGRFFAVEAELELALGVEGSQTTDGMGYGTAASEWSAGVRADLPIAGWRWTLAAAYGEHRFAVEDEAMPEELVPDVTYRWARGGLAVAVPVGTSLVVEGGGGWRHLLGTGELSSEAWFPRSTGNGIDAELGATWRPGGPVNLFARADLRRYFFAMNPELGDPQIAGGAVDQYLAVIAGIGIALE